MEVLHRGLAQPQFRSGSDHAGTDGGVERGDGGGDEGGEHREGMGGGQGRADGREGAVDEDPVAHQLPSQLRAAGEADDEPGDDQRHDDPGNVSGPARRLRHGLQLLDLFPGVRESLQQLLLQAFEVAGAHHGEDVLVSLVADLLQQPCGHVLVTLLDEGTVEILPVVGELGEGGLQDVALLELLDLLLFYLLPGDQGEQQAGEERPAFPPGEAGGSALERDTDLAVDEQDGQAVLLRQLDGPALFRAGFDAELLGDTLLVGGHGQAGDDHGGLALADHLHQVHLRHLVRCHQGLVAAGAELHGHRLVGLAVDELLHHVGAGLGDVGRAEQGDLAVVDGEVFDGFG